MQFTQGLHRSVQQTPNAIATICNGRQRSFTDLEDRVARLASGLKSQGYGKGDRIAILSLNSDYYLESYLAIAWLGAVVNPANFRWSSAEVVYSLNDSQTTGLIVDKQFAPMVKDILAGSPSVRNVFFADEGEAPDAMISVDALIAQNERVPDAEVGGQALFGIFYTGGTTGAPKGVMLSHDNICTSALALLAEGLLVEGSRGLHVAPMFHLADMMMTTGLLLRGGSHAFSQVFRPDLVLNLIQQHQVSDLLLVPAMLQALVDYPELAIYDLSSVKRVMYGASPASEALLDRAMTALPNTQFTQVYGMTETAAVMTVLPAEMHNAENRKLGKIRSGGRSATHVQIRIVDESGQEASRGEVGEITARGPNIMRGYLNKPEATEAAIRNGWMHTGDMGYMDEDGFVFIVDRIKDMIISGGENVYSVEVENAIMKYTGVAACAVIGIPCDDMGEKVHAALVLKPGSSVDQEALYQHCKTLIAGYKCPRSIEICDALPMSGAGKILKTELRKPFWENRDSHIA